MSWPQIPAHEEKEPERTGMPQRLVQGLNGVCHTNTVKVLSGLFLTIASGARTPIAGSAPEALAAMGSADFAWPLSLRESRQQ